MSVFLAIVTRSESQVRRKFARRLNLVHGIGLASCIGRCKHRQKMHLSVPLTIIFVRTLMPGGSQEAQEGWIPASCALLQPGQMVRQAMELALPPSELTNHHRLLLNPEAAFNLNVQRSSIEV